MDCFASFPGRAHCAAVYKDSPLFKILGDSLDVPGHHLQESYHIVADSAYPCLKHTMPAFKMIPTNKTPEKKKFNTHLASKWQVVEHAFALLVQRWPRLLKLRCKSMRKNIDTILAACILHNWCIICDDTDDDVFDMQPVVNNGDSHLGIPGNLIGAGNSAIGSAKHQLLVNMVNQHN